MPSLPNVKVHAGRNVHGAGYSWRSASILTAVICRGLGQRAVYTGFLRLCGTTPFLTCNPCHPHCTLKPGHTYGTHPSQVFLNCQLTMMVMKRLPLVYSELAHQNDTKHAPCTAALQLDFMISDYRTLAYTKTP